MRFSPEDRSPLVEFEDLVHLTFEALAEIPDFRWASRSTCCARDRLTGATRRPLPNAPPSSTTSR